MERHGRTLTDKERIERLEEMYKTLAQQNLGLVNLTRVLEKRIDDLEDYIAKRDVDLWHHHSRAELNQLWGDSDPRY